LPQYKLKSYRIFSFTSTTLKIGFSVTLVTYK
jgi:hypothetical protein